MPTLRDILATSRQQPGPSSEPRETIGSLLSQIGSTGVGAVASVANFIDTPAASVRAMLAGQSPTTALSSLTSGEGRLSGRDVLERYGMRPNRETGISGWFDDPGEGLRDIAGFGFEVLTDPFGPIGGWASRALGLTGAMARTAAARTAARAAVTPGVLRRLPKMAEAGQTLHPLVYGLGVAAKAAFDPLSPMGGQAIRSAFRGLKSGARAVFDKYGWGVTDPVLQNVTATVREAMRASSDQTQAQLAAFHLRSQYDLGVRFTVDQSLDMNDPANFFVEGSPLRVQANRDAVSRYLEDPDYRHAVRTATPGAAFNDPLRGLTSYDRGDLVTTHGSTDLREVEYTAKSPDGRWQVKLAGSSGLVDEDQLVPAFRPKHVILPTSVYDELDAYWIPAIAQARQEAVDAGWNVPVWRDPYAEYVPRAKSDVARMSEVVTGQTPQSWARARHGVAEALQVPGARELLYSHFREGTTGIRKLYLDEAYEQIAEKYRPPSRGGSLVTEPTIDTPSTLVPAGRQYPVGRRHAEDIAEQIGMDPEDFWAELWSLAGDDMPDRLSGVYVPGTSAVSVLDKARWDGVSAIPPMTGLLRVSPITPADTEVLLLGGGYTDAGGVLQSLHLTPSPDAVGYVDAAITGLRRSAEYRAAQISAIRATDVPSGAGDVLYRSLGFEPEPPRSGAAGVEDWVRQTQPQPQGDVWRDTPRKFAFPGTMDYDVFQRAFTRFVDRQNRAGIPVVPGANAVQFIIGNRALFNQHIGPVAKPVPGSVSPVPPGVYLEHMLGPDGLAIPTTSIWSPATGTTAVPWPQVPRSMDPAYPAFTAWAAANRVDLTDPDMVRMQNLIDRKPSNDAVAYYGMHRRAGGAPQPYVVQPALRSPLTRPGTLRYYLDRIAAQANTSPVLQAEAAMEDIYNHIGRSYNQTVDEYMPRFDPQTRTILARMPDGTPVPRGANAANPQDVTAPLGLSRPEWLNTFTDLVDLWTRTQATARGGVGPAATTFLRALEQRPSLMSAFRFDDRALQALGIPAAVRDELDLVRSDINGAISASLVPAYLDEIPFDYTIDTVSRYRALAAEIADRAERRQSGLFGDDPLVQVADGVQKQTAQAHYIRGAVGALTTLYRPTARKIFGSKSEIPGATTLGEWLSPPVDYTGKAVRRGLWPDNLVEGQFLDNLLRSIAEDRVFGGPRDVAASTFVDANWPVRYYLHPTDLFVDTAGKQLAGSDMEAARAYAHDILRTMELSSDQAEQLRTFTEIPAMSQMPELGPFLRMTANVTSASKAGFLLAVSTAVRDVLGSAINATLVGGSNLAVVARYGKAGLEFSRGAPIDPVELTGVNIPEISQMLASKGWADTPTNRGRAFQALYAAHHRAPFRHASLMTADVESQAISGSAEAVLNAVPGEGAGVVQDTIPTFVSAVGGGMSAVRHDISDRVRRSLAQPTIAGRATAMANEFINPMNVPGRYVEERGVPNWRQPAAGVQQFATPPRVLQGRENRVVRSSKGNFFTESLNSFRGALDTTTRAAVILEYLQRQKGAARLSDAFAYADKVLTNNDPRNFSRFENKWMRSLIPFYSFMRQSMPMFLRELTFNPGGGVGMAVRATRLAQGDDESYVPFALQDTTAIPIGTYDDGRAKFLTSLGLMHEDAVRYAGDILQGDVKGLLQKLIASGNPALKLAVEKATNTSLFAATPMGGRRLDDLDPTLGRILINLGITDVAPSGRAAPFLSPTVEAVAAASPLSRVLSTAKIISNPEDRTSSMEKVMRLLLGVKVETITPEQTLREIRDRLNAMEIAAGARPLTLATGTSKLRERLKALGNTEELQKLQQIDQLLKLLRKQEASRTQSP